MQKSVHHLILKKNLLCLLKGYQKRPESRIKEITEMPFPAEFFKEYVLKSLPIVIRGGVGDVPAMTNWEKDDYLKKKYVLYIYIYNFKVIVYLLFRWLHTYILI